LIIWFSKRFFHTSKNLKNIYSEGEIDINSTVAKNATVQMEATREVIREIDYYNLDAHQK
jgi:hypothetical protein